MSQDIKIRKGLNIRMKGKAEQLYASAAQADVYAVKPTDFAGITPKLLVKEGDKVLAGTPLFYSKDHADLVFCAPVSGEVAAIVRGEKRKLLEVRILADREIRYEDFGTADPGQLSAEELRGRLLKSGAWALIRQRPYAVVADPASVPRDIFISCFDSAPLGVDQDFVVHGQEKEFQTGVNALARLTAGKVHLGLDAGNTSASPFANTSNVVIHHFRGPHPAGNVGVQIHHVAPINKGDVVWTLTPQDVIIIGRLFLEGRLNLQRNIAVAGSSVAKPRYAKVIAGTNLKPLLEGQLAEGEKVRVISGNVLTGVKTTEDGFLGYYDQQVTVIPEGDEPEFFGWIVPGFNKFSMSRSVLSWLAPKKEYVLDTGMHGEERAFVMTGQYEKVFPFDIYPVQLLKSILVEDIDAMEQLGIYEVAEEDFALCEVVCTSKIPVQSIVRQGLDLVRKEMS